MNKKCLLYHISAARCSDEHLVFSESTIGDWGQLSERLRLIDEGQ